MTSGAGLMYAGIAVLWAAVLIPMWLRGHDNTVENRSAERFGQAMRVLSRRSAEGDVDEPAPEAPEAPAAIPNRAETKEPTRQPARRIGKGTIQRATQGATQRKRKSRPSLARRRARTLAVLAGATLLLGLLAGAGVLPLWAPLPVVVLLVSFVVHLRNQALRSDKLRARRAAPRTHPDERNGTEPVTAPADVAEVAPAAVLSNRHVEFVSGPSRAVVVETKRVGGATDAVAAAPTSEQLTAFGAVESDDEEWRPNPLPLPTYVTAPKAVRPIKVIDLTTPGAWSSGRLLDDELPSDEDLLAAELAADELDGLLEHEAKGSDNSDPDRRAVGD